MSNPGPKASLDLTHVLYDDASFLSFLLAIITLSPILLMASYAALAVQSRELTIIVMWAGQLTNEALNYIIKHIIREDRPTDMVGNGYGFPSSHSQYMGYFSSFLILHMFFKHRFSSSGYPLLDRAFRALIYLALLAWAGAVAYSRYRLNYHTPHQIYWGLFIGSSFAVSLYATFELLPFSSALKSFILTNPVSEFLEIRDGWAVWSDGGRQDEWKRWRREWEELRRKKRA
ncbi:PAP2-domain-containing protein [Marasmius fiardii PR-910]|nr:PAP2-domain-containing protein [Marasmius fiardii PR-910]